MVQIQGNIEHSPWLEGGIVGGKPTPTLEGWIADLKELLQKFPKSAVVYGGRGISANLVIATNEQAMYLQKAQALVRRVLKSMGSRAKEFTGPNSSKLYKALAEEFRTQFPGYELPYMIEYGAYGLVQDELARMSLKK